MHYNTHQFTDLLVVAIKGQGLGPLYATPLQDLERGIGIAGKQEAGKERGGTGAESEGGRIN